MGMGVFLACMPFFIKKGSRDTCLCVYHLRFDFMIEGLRRYFAKHGKANDADGEGEGDGAPVEELLKQPSLARAAFVCEKNNDGYYKQGCLDGTCATCGSLKLAQSLLEGSGCCLELSFKIWLAGAMVEKQRTAGWTTPMVAMPAKLVVAPL